MKWRNIDLFGAGRIARVCGLYEVTDVRVPGAKYRIKVLEREPGDFIAIVNVCVKASDGTPNWIAGLGGAEEEALQDAIRWFARDISGRANLTSDDFEWSDPMDF